MKKISFPMLVGLLLSSTLVLAQTRETRKVEDFTKISFRYPGKLYVKQGSPQKVEIEGNKDVLREIETEVEGSKLIIGKPGKWWDNWKWTDEDKVIVYITVPNIEALNVSGSGDIIGQGKITSNELDLNVSGSGSLELEADVKGSLDADVSGSGNIDMKGRCRNFDSHVSGSGRIVLAINVDEDASFGVSGSGKIQASGTAQMVKTNISGSGRVQAADLEANQCEVRISGSGDVEINVKNELTANISGSGSVTYKGNPNKINSHASGSGKVRKF